MKGVIQMLTTTVTTKGQVVIPAPLRKKLRLQKGSKLTVSEREGKIILEVLAKDPIETGRGMLTARGTVLKLLIQDREAESVR